MQRKLTDIRNFIFVISLLLFSLIYNSTHFFVHFKSLIKLCQIKTLKNFFRKDDQGQCATEKSAPSGYK